MMWWRILVALAVVVGSARAHGRVLQPASRSSAWRAGYLTAHDYDDDGANCGGFARQWHQNGGRCGICGDAYDTPQPRQHELGGVYGEGLIVEHYHPGSVFPVTVELTTSHRGYWEFKLCPDPTRNDQSCFDDYPLELEDGGNKYYPTEGSTKYNLNYRLPPGLVCDHCVIQWRYTAGNNWGICKNGTNGLGCGYQEQFGACSDVSIGGFRNSLDPVDFDHDEVYKEMPYPLFFYLKNGYFDTLTGNNEVDGEKIGENFGDK